MGDEAEFTSEELARHNLLCDTLRSRFYHNSFERRYSRWSGILTVVTGAAAIVSLTLLAQNSPEYSSFSGVGAALIAYIDALWKPGQKASVHCYKGQRMAELYNRVERSPNPSKKEVVLWKEILHEIEGGDGSVYHVLNHVCQNRVIDSLDLDKKYKRHLSHTQAFFRYLFTFENTEIPYVENPEITIS